MGVQFGFNIMIGGNVQDLFMDVYELEGDIVFVCFMVVMAFGGVFVFGQWEDFDGLCWLLVCKGYVVVMIDYCFFDVIIFVDFN